MQPLAALSRGARKSTASAVTGLVPFHGKTPGPGLPAAHIAKPALDSRNRAGYSYAV